MNILVLNCGSSSIKYQLFEMPARTRLAKGLIERIGEGQADIVFEDERGKHQENIRAANHDDGIAAILDRLVSGSRLGNSGQPAIAAVGHRVVHGGEEFRAAVVIDDSVLAAIEKVSRIAPLHNPPNVAGILGARQVLPNAPQVACFDTAFHATIPQVAHMYALPYELYERFGVRRYGFHGISHHYVMQRAGAMLGIDEAKLNCITCHLGNGCSVTAIRNGQSVDTSMGLTPLEGLVMGTRCGDIDPAILFYLADNGYDVQELNELCNKKSGLLGVSGLSNDMRSLVEAAENGNERARLAIGLFCYRLKKYIGAYWASLGRVDAIVFTGGIGENAAAIREQVCAGLEPLGITIEAQANLAASGHESRVSADNSQVKLLVIPTDEEGAIAAETYRLATAGHIA
ncbi:MAG: acetate kinase [Pirellulales bacterium]